MEFCPKCGSMLRLKEKEFHCKCGWKGSPVKPHVVESHGPKPGLSILESEINPLAVYSHKCSNCGFEKAQLASKGIQYTDEDEEVEFVCGRCGHHDKAEGLRPK
jgi:DNA-directed RNA polymerase subunit M/transcription elongation factor TFIIS